MGASVPSTSRITAARSGASASRAIASMAHRISPMGLIVVGLVAGLFSALFGVGGGIVIVPMLLLLHRYTTRVAMATSLVSIAFVAIVGSITYAAHGEIKPGAAALVGIPAALGAVGGTWLQQRVPTRWLSIAFAGVLVAVAVELLVSA